MKYLFLLLLSGCQINVPERIKVDDVQVNHDVNDINIEFDNSTLVLISCMSKLEKLDIDEEVIECYYKTIQELKNEHRPKDY